MENSYSNLNLIKKLLTHTPILSLSEQHTELWLKSNARGIIISSIFISVFLVIMIGCFWSICSTTRGKKQRKEDEKKSKEQQEGDNDKSYHSNDDNSFNYRETQLNGGEKSSIGITHGKPNEEEEYRLLSPDAQLEYEYYCKFLLFIQ